MNHYFRINGARVGELATPEPLPDPIDRFWSPPVGDFERSFSGRLQSLAFLDVELVFPPLYGSQFKVLYDFWTGLLSAGMVVNSITVPTRRGHTGSAYWQTYTAPDYRGILAEPPREESTGGISVLGVRWLFRRVVPAVSG